MPILLPSVSSSAWKIRQLLPQLRWLHSRKGGASKVDAPPPLQGLSLLDELFPEEIKDARTAPKKSKRTPRIPRLPLPNLDEEGGNHAADRYFLDGQRSFAAFVNRDSLRQWNLSVLIIRRASKSLIESDFRRIAPKGQHINDWKGPGDILQGNQ